MTLAGTLAQEIARKHGTNPWRVAERLGLVVTRDELPGAHREVYFNKGGICGVIVTAAARQAEARGLLAHGIAHHLLHVGDRVTGGSRAIWSGRHEREADDFAACLLIPDDVIRTWIEQVDPLAPSDLALEIEVPEQLVRRRIAIERRNQQVA